MSAASAVLVTGGAGFIGCNLADRLAHDGHDVIVFDSLARSGAEHNLQWLRHRHPRRIAAIVGDVRDREAVGSAVGRAKAVFHLAAQVAVTTSLTDPRADFDVNLCGTINVLEAARQRSAPPPVIFASTNKVYGDLDDVQLVRTASAYEPRDPALRAHGIAESRHLSFHTPYGCSKGAADQYVTDYARSFGVPTAVLRMSCIYGRRQRGTEDQGWVAHFLLRMLRDEPITIYGDGAQVRDILWIDDAVDAYISLWERIDTVRGQSFNLGGGPANAVSLLTVVEHLEQVLGRSAALQFKEWRIGDQRYFVTDPRRVQETLSLKPPRDWRNGLTALAAWFLSEQVAMTNVEAAQ